MKTSASTLSSLHLARAQSRGDCVIGGDVLDTIVADLDELARREREWDASLQQLEQARDDSSPRSAHLDDDLVNRCPL